MSYGKNLEVKAWHECYKAFLKGLDNAERKHDEPGDNTSEEKQ